MEAIFFLEICLSGLGNAALYAFAGIAFVLIYKATRVINLAIGEIMMLGAYVFLGLSSAFSLPIGLAIPLTLVAGAGIGMLLERATIRPMLGESPIAVFMLTIGLASILTGLVELTWGTSPRQMPAFMPSDPIFLGPAYLSPRVAYAFVTATLIIVAFLLVFRSWRGGVALRATAADQGAAYMMGINVPRVFSLSWGVACLAASGAGILLGTIGGLSPGMAHFGLSVLVVVIVGGLDSFGGALFGGLLVGLAEALSGAYLGGEYAQITTFTLLLAVLLVRPHGLFGSEEIERV